MNKRDEKAKQYVGKMIWSYFGSKATVQAAEPKAQVTKASVAKVVAALSCQKR